MFEVYRKDLYRYKNKKIGYLKDISYKLCNQAIWALSIYRFGSWVYKAKIPLIAIFLKIIYFVLNKFIEIITGISIPASVHIGPGLYIGHYGGIIIHPNTTIGSNFSIGQGVTIGTQGLGKKGVPIIGDNVYIGVGAKVLGQISIGNNVRIGANAVVIKDVPDNAVAVGVPAKVVKFTNHENS
jgi:serine O-acetyltransferase